MSTPKNGTEPLPGFIATDSLRIYSVLMIGWTLLVVALTIGFIRYVDWVYTDLLRTHINASCDRDLLFREWCAKFGGVYADANLLEPNPWLHHPRREVVTNYGDSLTLINPAWMTRQINEMQEGAEERKIISRLTSSKLVNPNNKADAWEEAALELLETKQQDMIFDVFRDAENHEKVRLAKPLKVLPGCLNCHDYQGYSIGDIRGIISIEVNADEMFAVKYFVRRLIAFTSIGVWLFGIVVLVFSQRRLNAYFKANRIAWNNLLEKEEAVLHSRDQLEVIADDLRHAKEIAERASLAKSQFLATMSHEIRTPLSGVIGISNLLMEQSLQPKQLEYARLIKASGESLLFLVNDILDFSKIEAGRVELEESEFIVHDLVDSVLLTLAPKAHEKRLDLVATFDNMVPGPVVGDAGRLRQVLINLTSNALKFSAQGGVRIHVELDKLFDQQISLKFSITDTGIGIPKEQQNRLFKSFSQVDASTSRVYGGTGLGLAISKKLVELMHGDVHIDSEEGKGATFWFTARFGCLPLVLKCMRANIHPCITEKRDYCKGDPPQRCARSGREVVYLQRVAEIKGLSILLVGSSEVMIPALIEQMQCWGTFVEHVGSPSEAIQRLKNDHDFPFRLVIVDVALNDPDAESLICTIQENDRLKETAVICLTPLSEDLLKKSWKFPDKIRCVTKPICCSALLDAVVRSFFKLPESPFTVPAVGMESKQSARVLAVDDNRINRIVIAEILKNAGMECVVVESGAAAVECIKTEQFDVVLMDCQMPVMDGYETTIRIRQRESEMSYPTRLPIIALTANVTAEDVKKCFDSGMDAYCSKPVNPAHLFKKIERFLDAKQKMT